ncbi:Hrp-dependent type III effector protein [Bryobacterales bacterium F-183]|nr:Hrp-dependent type III effector protein [Bryobacterales bacterium F-183]
MELWALQKVYPGRELLYVPAYPALGRTVRNGHLVLNGTPIHETEFARDALNPIRTSDVGYVMAPAVGEILDSETEDDLGAIAQRIAADPGRYLMAGPAAIARYLAASGSGSRQDDGISLGRLAERRLLVVNGSRHSTSAGQIEFARGRGLFERLPWSEFQYQGGGSGVARAEAAGGEVRACLQRGSFDGILVFGGDTAYGIYSALHEPFLEGAGELLPGVPISRSQSGLWWITKAGGFGSVDLLERLSQFDLSASPSSSSS